MLLQEGKDNINPDHYKKACSIECIDAMLLGFGVRKVVDYCLINAFKYIWRYQNKNGMEDLNKAEWYCNEASTILEKFDEILYSPEERTYYIEKLSVFFAMLNRCRANYVTEVE